MAPGGRGRAGARGSLGQRGLDHRLHRRCSFARVGQKEPALGRVVAGLAALGEKGGVGLGTVALVHPQEQREAATDHDSRQNEDPPRPAGEPIEQAIEHHSARSVIAVAEADFG